MELVKSGYNGEQVPFIRPIDLHWKMHFGTEASGLKSEGDLNFKLSL